MPDNQEIILAKRPSRALSPTHFQVRSSPRPAPKQDEALLAVEWLAMDPYLRGLIAGRHLDSAPQPGQRMPGQGIARVIEAPANSSVKPGDRVLADCGWAHWLTRPAHELQPINLPTDVPVQAALGILGMPGLTAWSGLHRLARLEQGETVAVSSASGTVGAAVIGLARAVGCITVGITSAHKRDYVADSLGADHVVIRDQSLSEQLLANQIPKIDVAFDNAGGSVLEAMLGHLALQARVVLCGMISQYELDQRPAGPNLGPVIASRATLKGLVVYDHFDAMAAFLDQAVPLYRAGNLRCEETHYHGLDRAPEALCALLSGKTHGRILVRVDGHDIEKT